MGSLVLAGKDPAWFCGCRMERQTPLTCLLTRACGAPGRGQGVRVVEWRVLPGVMPPVLTTPAASLLRLLIIHSTNTCWTYMRRRAPAIPKIVHHWVVRNDFILQLSTWNSGVMCIKCFYPCTTFQDNCLNFKR